MAVGRGGEPPQAIIAPHRPVAVGNARANIAGVMRVGDGGAKLAVRNGARNGGRARCPHRAASSRGRR